MKRARALSARPRSARNASRSAGSSSAISASSRAESAIASAPSARARAATPSESGTAAAASGTFSTTRRGRRGLALEPGGERLPLGALGGGGGGALLGERPGGRRLGHVQQDGEGAEREEREAGEQRPLFGREAGGPERRARLERRRQALEQ